jgi:hypothetical protein
VGIASNPERLVFAQDPITSTFQIEIPQQPPETAKEGVDWLRVALVALAGLVGTRLTEAISKLPFPGNDKIAIRQPLLDLTAAVLSILTGYLLASATSLAGFLDDSGWWQVVIWAWPSAVAWFKGLRITERFSRS